MRRGILRKTRKGWFVETFMVSDRPPFFKREDIPVMSEEWEELKEGETVEFSLSLSYTQVKQRKPILMAIPIFKADPLVELSLIHI